MCLYFIYYLYKEILFLLSLTTLVSKPFIYYKAYSGAHIVIMNLSETQDNKTVKNKTKPETI